MMIILLGWLSTAFTVPELAIGVQLSFIELGVDTFASVISSPGLGFSRSPSPEETSFH